MKCAACSPVRMRSGPGRSRRGFSLIEAMISAAVLGIALVGLVEMHTTSIRGTAKAEDVGRATEIARQLADRVASQPLDQMPGCGSAIVPLAQTGCRGTPGPGRVLANAKPGLDCTRIVNEDAVTNALSGDIETLTSVDPTLPSGTSPGAFRVDTWLSAHPNGAAGTALVNVWVCWRDPSGAVQEVATQRVKIEGVW